MPKAMADLLGQLVEVVQQSSDLSLQAEHPLDKTAQGLFRCRAGGVNQCYTEGCTGGHEGVVYQRLQLFP